MKIYNTLTSKKDDLKIPPSGEINLFVCGPTVYDYSHIGHARTYIFFDALIKFMRVKLGFKVNYLQNITNIDDKIIKRSAEENKNPQEVADFFEKEYIADMHSLGVNAVDTYAPATKYIPEIISQVERLIKKGFAYEANGSVYFDVRKFPEYGKLSHQKIEDLKEGVRVDVEPGKKFFADFALWKASKDGEPYSAKATKGEPTWDSPWGKGRPGWHIEDTAITEKHFGSRYNIHGGGMDLIFPHHEAEIAQMEAISGLSPLAEVWIHTGMLLVDGEKMSKSLGNFITIRDFLKENSPQTLRFMVLSHHYRTGLDFSKKTIQMANSSINRIADFKERLKSINGQSSSFPWEDFEKTFWHELTDDFNTPKALASLFELVTETNKLIDSNSLSHSDAQKIIDFIDRVNDILNILPEEESIPLEVNALITDREKTRTNKDFKTSDELRDKIKELGWEVEDTPSGPRVTKL